MRVFKATYTKATYTGGENKGVEKVIPVAAQSLQHAARKAAKEEDEYGELTKLELTKDILI